MTEPIENSDHGSVRLLTEISRDLRGYLEYMKGLGCRRVILSEESMRILESWGREGVGETLGDIRKDLGECRRCKLERGRKQIVFGAGDPKARMVLVGEAPGFEEDAQGIPFVGKAGQLLTKMLQAIDLSRDEVYICNILKCRPPRNRNPERDEIAACIPFLERQIRAIAPRLICTLGTFAAQTLLKTSEPISRLRGRFYTYEEVPLLPTYHPAFLLRNPRRKREAWEDMQKLQEAYEKA